MAITCSRRTPYLYALSQAVLQDLIPFVGVLLGTARSVVPRVVDGEVTYLAMGVPRSHPRTVAWLIIRGDAREKPLSIRRRKIHKEVDTPLPCAARCTKNGPGPLALTGTVSTVRIPSLSRLEGEIPSI